MKISQLDQRELTPASDFEVLFFPLEKLVEKSKPRRWQDLVNSKDSKWTESAASQLEKKLEDIELSKTAKYLSLTIHFDAGGSCVLFFLAKDIDGFGLQTELRKHLARPLKSKTFKRIVVRIEALSKVQQGSLVSWISSLAHLCQWEPETFKKTTLKKADSKKTVAYNLLFGTKLAPSQVNDLIRVGEELARANNLVRTLSELPSNVLDPKEYRKRLQSRSREKKYSFDFWGRPELTRKKAGAFLAVTQAVSKDFSGIAHLSLKPKGAKKKLALVGKGVCFDTGGNNIKTGGHMGGMHRDMTGSAVALALFEALGALKFHSKMNCEIHCYLAIAENLVSATAYRPNDVVVACDGTSIEVVDTDAEGRMVLSDALALARREKPNLVLDFATLTGAAVYSIGTQRGAVFSNQNSLLKMAHEVGEVSGERNWPFPIGQEYKEALKSEIADTLQCSSVRGSDHIYAATFLSHFVGDETPWLHLDLSCAEHKGGLGLVDSYCTGYGVRWGYEVVQRFFKDHS